MTTLRPLTALTTRRHAIVGAGSLALGVALGAAQRDAAGQAAPAPASGGVTFQRLSFGVPVSLGGKTLELLRITIQPGEAFVTQARFGPVAMRVEQGALDLEIVDGDSTIARALVDETWGAQRAMVAGDTTYIATGDSLFHDGATHVLVNAGAVPARVLASMVHDAAVSATTWLEPA